MIRDYELVIGLEVHMELATQTKIFCNCSTGFGAEPNTQCCPVCIGMPGTLPVLNRKVVEYAIKAGLAAHCEIAVFSKQDRKNYFYPDLPKAYQISQYDMPLCRGGYVDVLTSAGGRRIGINHIHIEEDAGKLIHVEGQGTLIDCNRCGVPLIEIVTEPDMRSADEAIALLQKMRAIALYTGISDGRMEQGSLRCDVNISVRKPGESLGTRAELKNINSFQSIQRAIEYEYQRQVALVEAGESVVQETRRFDHASGRTYSMRTKEDESDYRYFPDPDLPPIHVSMERLTQFKETMPALPDERRLRYTAEYGLTQLDAEKLVQRKGIADAFEAAAACLSADKIKPLANLMLGELAHLLDDSDRVPVMPEHIARVCELSAIGTISSGGAKRLMQALWTSDDDPDIYVDKLGLKQLSDEAALMPYAAEAISANSALADSYRAGKLGALNAITGMAMKLAHGSANPAALQALIKRELEK